MYAQPGNAGLPTGASSQGHAPTLYNPAGKAVIVLCNFYFKIFNGIGWLCRSSC